MMGGAIVETIGNYGAPDCLLVAHYEQPGTLVDRWERRPGG